MEKWGTEIASGWVTVNDFLKFPVKVRSYVDENGKKGTFVSYPQRKSGDSYQNIIYPHDAKVREEIEKEIFQSMKNGIQKEIYHPEITDIHITTLKESTEEQKISLRGIATIKMDGFTISGIMIKESTSGLFVDMPQHKSGNVYKDTVYATTKFAQGMIKESVLDAYQNVKEQELLSKKQPDAHRQKPKTL